MKIKAESAATRCEVCHQNDCFDPKTNYCRRCTRIASPTTSNLLKHKNTFSKAFSFLLENLLIGICGCVILPFVYLLKNINADFDSYNFPYLLLMALFGGYACLIGNLFSSIFTSQIKDNCWRCLSWAAVLMAYLQISFICGLFLKELPYSWANLSILWNSLKLTLVLVLISKLFPRLTFNRWVLFAMYVGTMINPLSNLSILPTRCGNPFITAVWVSSVTGIAWGGIIGIIIVGTINLYQKRNKKFLPF